MRGFLLGLSISAAFILGTVFASYYVKPAYANSPAAQKQYTECISTTTWFGRGRDINNGRLPKKRLLVPNGWTPIGAGGPTGDGVEPYILLCR